MALDPHHPNPTPDLTPPATTSTPTTTATGSRAPIKTHHCRFCNHLLLATTRDMARLPRRKEPARDGCLILPLPAPAPAATGEEEDDDDEAEVEDHDDGDNGRGKGGEGDRDGNKKSPGTTKTTKTRHYSILLSTTLPDRRATLVRREDGFEKRVFLRCGRCRVVVGYFLDGVHFPSSQGETVTGDTNNGNGAREKVVYLLPGALVETGLMTAAAGDERIKAMDAEWSGWIA